MAADSTVSLLLARAATSWIVLSRADRSEDDDDDDIFATVYGTSTVQYGGRTVRLGKNRRTSFTDLLLQFETRTVLSLL